MFFVSSLQTQLAEGDSDIVPMSRSYCHGSPLAPAAQIWKKEHLSANDPSDILGTRVWFFATTLARRVPPKFLCAKGSSIQG